MVPIAPHSHSHVLLGYGHAHRNLRQGAVKVRVEHRKIRNPRKQPQCLAHDVNRDGCVQRRKSCVAFDLVDQRRRNALVLADGGPSANHAVSDGRR